MTEDMQLIMLAAGSCSLAASPGDDDNWVERAGPGGKGGKLPNYICQIAKGVMRSGKSKSAAIAIAVDRVKKWAAGGDDVNADTRAKAARALAQWEKLKAKNKSNKIVQATNPATDEPYLLLTNIDSFNTDLVRIAWRRYIEDLRYAKVTWGPDFERRPHQGSAELADASEYPYQPYFNPMLEELWTDHVISAVWDRFDNRRYFKVPYEVVDKNTIVFGIPQEVYMTYEPYQQDELTDEEETIVLSNLSGVV